jgi:hypothetical protein
MSVTDLFENIELKIKQLALKVERLEKENVSLKSENEKQKVELDLQKDAVSDLNEQLLEAQMAVSSKKNEDREYSEQLKQQMDQYIKEIDKCIEWLHNN